MTIQFDHHAPNAKGATRLYSPDLLAHVQDLLSALADLDYALERDLEEARISFLSEPAQLETIEELHRRHHERRASIAMELAALEKKIARVLQL